MKNLSKIQIVAIVISLVAAISVFAPWVSIYGAANINGQAVSAIMLVARWKTYAAFWPSLLSAVRTAMVPMSFFEVSLLINPSL